MNTEKDLQWKLALQYYFKKQLVFLISPEFAHNSIVQQGTYEDIYDFYSAFSKVDVYDARQTEAQILHACRVQVGKLASLNYIETLDLEEGEKEYSTFITAKGVEVALKLQEHEDNERRFNQQKKFSEAQLDISKSQKNISESQKLVSEALKINSDKSVTTAKLALGFTLIALGIGIFRVYQLEEKIVSHETIDNRILELESNYHALALNNEKRRSAATTIEKDPHVDLIITDNVTKAVAIPELNAKKIQVTNPVNK